MKLTKLPNGNWIDPSSVTEINSFNSDTYHKARVVVHTRRGPQIIWVDDEKLTSVAEEIAKIVNWPTPIGEVSDGYHTFNELYEHRHALFLNLMQGRNSWISKLHDDGSSMEGWFIAGIHLDSGMVTYHLPERLWDKACQSCKEVLDKAPFWDGHTSKDVVDRLYNDLVKFKDTILNYSGYVE